MATKESNELGRRYGRPDVERVGLFSEMPYMNGKGYVSPFGKFKTEKGRNIIGEGPKIKTGRADCYFEKEFKRLFTGECIKGRGRKPIPSKFKNVSGPFIPTGSGKIHSTPGDYYGTFSGKIEAFSNKKKTQPPRKKEGKNFLTSLVKKGGCGYANIALNPYPEHPINKYGFKPKQKIYGRVLDGPMVTSNYPKPFFEENPFKEEKLGPTYLKPKEKIIKVLPPGILIPTGPGKLPGGCHAGCFDKFPEHKANKYITIWDLEKPRRETAGIAGKCVPHSWGEKSFYTTSVVNENLRFRVNQRNQMTYEPMFTKYLAQ